MSNEAQAVAWNCAVDHSPTRFVLVALADRADEHGHCWPSIPTLMRKTRLKRTAVKDALRFLEREALLVRAPRFDEHGRQRSNNYRIDLEALGRWPAGAGGEGS